MVIVHVHAVHQGVVLCGFSRDIPANWPEDHRWAPIRNLSAITCKKCQSAAKVILARDATKQLDDDEWQVRESEQQQLLEGIISKLHRLTGDNGENYPKVFGAIAQLIIWRITDGFRHEERDHPVGESSTIERISGLRLYATEVMTPVYAFCGLDNEEEFLFLLGQLLERSIVTIRTPSINAYGLKMLNARRK